ACRAAPGRAHPHPRGLRRALSRAAAVARGRTACPRRRDRGMAGQRPARGLAPLPGRVARAARRRPADRGSCAGRPARPRGSALRRPAPRAPFADQERLADSGHDPRTAVLIRQLVSFESYLQRLVAGLAALRGLAVPVADAPVRTPRTRGRAAAHGGTTRTGRTRPTHFT